MFKQYKAGTAYKPHNTPGLQKQVTPIEEVARRAAGFYLAKRDRLEAGGGHPGSEILVRIPVYPVTSEAATSAKFRRELATRLIDTRMYYRDDYSRDTLEVMAMRQGFEFVEVNPEDFL